MCNIFIEFGVSMKLVRLIKICLKENYSGVRVGKHLFHILPLRIGMKQIDALLPMPFNFALVYVIRRVQLNQVGLKLKGTHQLLFYADDVYVASNCTLRVLNNFLGTME